MAFSGWGSNSPAPGRPANSIPLGASGKAPLDHKLPFRAIWCVFRQSLRKIMTKVVSQAFPMLTLEHQVLATTSYLQPYLAVLQLDNRGPNH